MRKPKGVIFDLGGTILFLEWVNLIDGNRRLLDFVDNDVDIAAEEFQLITEEISNNIFRLQDETNLQTRVQETYRLIFETLGLSLNIDYPEMERHYWNAAVKYTPNEGIYDVLDTLDKYEIRTGILSNSGFSGNVLCEELEKHDLAHRFSFIISTADYGIRKPDKRIFDVAIKRIGLKPDEVWFAGDKVGKDIQGAIKSGLFPILYNWRNESVEIEKAHLIVKDWYEFIDKIDLLYND